MDDIRIGTALRELRRRAGLRQVDLAAKAHVSQSLISSIEAGHLATVTVETLRRVFRALGAGFEGQVLWRGPGLDRLLDARHARLVATAAERYARLVWDPRIEVTYAIYGERGSIDILAGHEARRAVAVNEVKSEIVRLEETVRKTDEKARLVRAQVAEETFGWVPDHVARLLILPDTDRARRQVFRLATVLDLAFPARGAEVRAWLREPVGDLAGILFVPDISRGGGSAAARGVIRVRKSNGAADPPEEAVG